MRAPAVLEPAGTSPAMPLKRLVRRTWPSGDFSRRKRWLGAARALDGHAAEGVDQAHVAVRRLLQAELLVGAVQVVPLHHGGAGGLRPAVVVQHVAGVAVLQPVVAVPRVDEPPLLVGPVV